MKRGRQGFRGKKAGKLSEKTGRGATATNPDEKKSRISSGGAANSGGYPPTGGREKGMTQQTDFGREKRQVIKERKAEELSGEGGSSAIKEESETGGQKEFNERVSWDQ